MGRSSLDRLAIAAVYMSGIVEAEQAAMSKAPDVARVYPVLNLTGIWYFVPLAFISLATLLWLAERGVMLVRRVRRRRTLEQSAPNSLPALVPTIRVPDGATTGHHVRINWKRLWVWARGILLLAAVGFLVAWVISIISANIRAAHVAIEASSRMKEPPVVRGAVTFAFIKQTLTQDPVSAEATLSKFLGTTMRVSGVIHEISTQRGFQTYIFNLVGKNMGTPVYVIFNSDTSGLSAYNEGDHIAAACKIERLDATGIGLDGCTVIPDEAWTSPVAPPPPP